MTKYKFDCGCQVEIVDDIVKENDGLPGLYIDYENIPDDCPATWDMIKSGRTKGIFQLEMNHGRKWAKKLAPNNLLEMSALVSLMRPGCIHAITDGKSMTEHYCDRKNIGAPVKYLHPALEPILQETYGVLTYQEQSMRIAQAIALFDLQAADILRKAMGKKKADIMSQVKGDFIKGCMKAGIVSKEGAEEIFGWIQESQRYSFNKSHGMCYGAMGYWAAYAKTHFPYHFYTAWLYYAHYSSKPKPQEEMRLLISDARFFNVAVKTPSLKHIYRGDIGHFALQNDNIYFGVGDIKGIGEALITKIITNIQAAEQHLQRSVDKWTWSDFLIHFSDTITTVSVNGLIEAGATDYIPGSRSIKVKEYGAWKDLTQKERDWIKENCANLPLLDAVEYLLTNRPRTSEPRKAKIEDICRELRNISYSVEDEPGYIARKEAELLGVPITYVPLETCNKKVQPNTTCKEFLQGKSGKMTIAVEIVDVQEYIIKKKGPMKGRKMARLSVEDLTAPISEVTVFPDALDGHSSELYKGSTVLLSGQRDRRKADAFIVNEITQI